MGRQRDRSGLSGKEAVMDNEREELLEILRSYYGTAALNGFPAAASDLFDLDSLDEDELRELAQELGL